MGSILWMDCHPRVVKISPTVSTLPPPVFSSASRNFIPKLLSEFAFVETTDADGSGVIFTRTDATGNEVVFVWTCAHVVKTLDDPTGKKPRILESCINVVIDKENYPAHIVAYDDSEK